MKGFSQAVAPAADSLQEEAIQMLEFFVSEKGVSRASNAITAKEAAVALPGASVEKLLSKIPGVNIRSTDPFGFYEGGNDIRVRSFGISALAVTVDDIPMGNNSGRYGTPVGRMVDSENLSTITVSQGTGDVTAPAYEALGGAIKYYTMNPSKEMGATAKFSMGDFDMQRTFFKFETGEIFPGFTSYVSTSKFEFKSAGLPKDSDLDKLEAKVRYETERASFSLAFTWNDRDDYDTRSTQWDRWRALETGDPWAGYGTAAIGTIYGAAEQNNLKIYAANGYTVYLPYTMAAVAAKAGVPGAALPSNLQGNYTDRARNFGALSYLGVAEAMGDGVYDQYYKYWRNGRMDALTRGSADITVTDEIQLLLGGYYQDRHQYGTFPVSRAAARTQIVSAYNPANNRINGVATPQTLRTDIWPRWAYQLNGQLVPYGTAGAVPVGYTDANGNGFYDVGESLNGSVPTAFSNGHALIAPNQTGASTGVYAPGIPGATGRDEDFGGERFGFTVKGTWTKGINKLSIGGWYENDEQQAYRPTYNLEGGSPEGTFLYDQVLFNNYQQNFSNDVRLFYVEDVFKLLDEKLSVTLGAKSLHVEKKAAGILYTNLFWRQQGEQGIKRRAIYKDNFLPQVGLGYTLSPAVEFFAGYAENLAAPNNAVIANIEFDSSLRPERASNYEAGIRYSGKSFGASLALFFNQYEDRILVVTLTQEELIQRGLVGVTGASTYRNVGGIDSSGAELSFDWRTPVKGLRLSGAAAYQKSEFAEDLIVNYAAFHSSTTDPRAQFYRPIQNPAYVPGSTDPTQAQYVQSRELQKGLTQGNTPEFTLKVDAFYAWKFLEFNFGAEFFDSVYVNTLNTERLPSWVNFNAGLTVRGPRSKKLDGISANLTVQNVFDEYIWRASGYNGAFNGTVTPDYGRNIAFTVEARF